MVKVQVFLSISILIFVFVACKEKISDPSIEDTSRTIQSIQHLGAGEMFTGVGFNGESRSCKEVQSNQDVSCTTEFTEEDQFALECERSGSVAVACGCHDWICVDFEDYKKQKDDIQEHTGLNFNGEVESCSQMSEEMSCTMEFTPEDQFAIDCRETGNEAIQCGCHKYICVES